MAHQIHLFARVWLMQRKYFKSEEPELESDWVVPMADMFLDYLSQLVRETGAVVPRTGYSDPEEAAAR